MLFGIIADVVLPQKSVFANDNEKSNMVLPEIYIKSVNPGYTENNIKNTGEMIEIGRRDAGDMISLAGLTVGYTNSNSRTYTIVEFPENSFMVGETILLRLASSPDHELANLNYSTTLASNAGPLTLMKGEEVIDSVCWTGKNGCEKSFDTGSPTVLVRQEDGSFKHILMSEYIIKYDEKNYYLKDENGVVNDTESRCKGIEFSELLSYYEETQKEQFIELFNSNAEQVLLDGCSVRYKNKMYPLNGIIKPENYYARYLIDFSIAKNPSNFGLLELIDVNGEIIDELEYPNGQRKGTSWAFVGYDAEGKEIWRTTYKPTPNEANNYQEYRTCEEGKVINELTGNCVKVTEITEELCPEGQYLNILTNRCKTFEVASEKKCKEGYYYNEETGRCRKIIENDGANYGLVTELYEEKTSFVALYAVIGVVAVGLLYMLYEFRRELKITKVIDAVKRRVKMIIRR